MKLPKENESGRGSLAGGPHPEGLPHGGHQDLLQVRRRGAHLQGLPQRLGTAGKVLCSTSENLGFIANFYL